ncbi:MAG: hypothetical protein AAGD96_32355 [Chloroflexota bacterium]
MNFLTGNSKLPWWALIPAVLIILVYGMLSFIAFFNPESWYGSMGIPVPEHAFLLISWGGKNTAMVVSILLALISRQRLPMAIALAVFFTGQLGDTVAGAQTGVNVFVTYIGMGLVAAQLVVMWASSLRDTAADVEVAPTV